MSNQTEEFKGYKCDTCLNWNSDGLTKTCLDCNKNSNFISKDAYMPEIELLEKYIAIKKQGFFFTKGECLQAKETHLVALNGNYIIKKEYDVKTRDSFEISLEDVFIKQPIPKPPEPVENQLSEKEYKNGVSDSQMLLFIEINGIVQPAIRGVNIKTWQEIHG